MPRGYTVPDLAQIPFVTCDVVAAPLPGRLIARVGERATFILGNAALVMVLVGYATTAGGAAAGAPFAADGVSFLLTIAQRTRLRKIADPADIAPTSGVALTIDQIAAVVIPVALRMIRVRDPAIVFQVGAGVALGSLGLALPVPRRPEPGRETVLTPAPRAAPAEWAGASGRRRGGPGSRRGPGTISAGPRPPEGPGAVRSERAPTPGARGCARRGRRARA